MVPSPPEWFYWMAFFGMAVISVSVIVGVSMIGWWAVDHVSISMR